MRKQSVLIRRALLFTAIVALVAVAVGLPVFLLMNNHYALQTARETLLPQARILAQTAASSNGDRFLGEAEMLRLEGIAAVTSGDADIDPSILYGLPGAEVARPVLRLTGRVMSTKPLQKM